MEDHYEELKAKMPLLITVIKEINQPRIPSLKGMLKAKKAEISVCKSCEVEGEKCNYGQDGSPTRVVDVWTEQMQKEGKKVEGEVEELADALFNELKNLGVV
jgi:electron transfer flavoprotein beta subunit